MSNNTVEVFRQNIMISSSNKSDISNLNNDINLSFPSTLFFKPPTSIQLVSFDIKLETSTFGNTNNYFIVTINDDTDNITDYHIVPHFNPFIPDDATLATVIETALNFETYENYPGLIFTCTHTSIENIITNYKVEQDDSTSIFNISSTRPVQLQFDVKDSIGPLIGFGNGVYNNITSIEGTSVQSIETYNSITSFNETKSTLIFPNYNDINCKMELFDSDNNHIENIDNPDDCTISLGVGGTSKFYTKIWLFLLDLETELNRYSTSFVPNANFVISYDYITNKVTINNTTGARWGFSFDFSVIDNGSRINSGSMHKILGFEQSTYLGQISYTSVTKSRAFGNTFADDYILLCSDLISNNTDRNVIGISNGNAVKSNNILFAIPLSLSTNFLPNQLDNYTLNIKSSNFSIGYREGKFNENNPAELNFYLRLLSGRHVQSTANWTCMISFTY
jgi:hypothetical protein